MVMQMQQLASQSLASSVSLIVNKGSAQALPLLIGLSQYHLTGNTQWALTGVAGVAGVADLTLARDAPKLVTTSRV